METKKITSLFLIFVLWVSCIFGQDDNFSIHLKKAKDFEAQKRYVSALGEYYEAMSVEKSLTGRTAYEGWSSLSEIIQSGKPGYGDFDEFTFVDEWILQLQDFEKYWTENCPILIICNNPERIELNRENKTATYEMKLTWQLSPKYKEIEQIFKTGLKKAYTKDWQMPFLEEWPNVSVYNTSKDKNKFLQNGAALTQNLSKYNNSGRYIYSEFKLIASLATFGCIKRNLAGYYDAYDPTTLYDVKLKIVDDSRKDLFLGKRLLLGPIAKYTFTVTQEQMKKIEDKKITVLPDAVYLQYGNIPLEPWITEDSRDWIKPLSEITLDNNNVKVIFKDELKKYETSSVEDLKSIVNDYQRQETSRIRQEQRQQEEQERQKALREENLRELENTWNSLVYVASASYKYPYGKYLVTTPEGITSAISYFNRLFPEIEEKYSYEQILYATRVVLCNEASKFDKKEQAYSIPENGEGLTFTDKILLCLENLSSINPNIKAKGYRVPNQNEKDYLLKRNNAISPIIDYIIIQNSK